MIWAKPAAATAAPLVVLGGAVFLLLFNPFGLETGLAAHLFAAFGEAAKLIGDEFTASKSLPELTILGAFGEGRVCEHAVMLALHFGKAVADDGEKVLVGCQDRAVEVELDDTGELLAYQRTGRYLRGQTANGGNA